MKRDVVCGMSVDPAEAPLTGEYLGQTYYFCSPACKARFEAKPEQFVR